MAEPIERVIEDVLRYRVATEQLIAGLRNQTGSSDNDTRWFECPAGHCTSLT